MRKYLARRALFALSTLIGVSLIVFVVLRILPGDPLVAILGVEGHARMTPADRVRIMRDLGLSDPPPVQYVRWLGDIAKGQLGKSFFRGDTVAELILHRGPISVEIAFLALAASWLVGLPVGIVSEAQQRDGHPGPLLTILFIAIPGFWPSTTSCACRTSATSSATGSSQCSPPSSTRWSPMPRARPST